MRVGFVGLGKLGLPVATAMASRGVHVLGFDIDPWRRRYDNGGFLEEGLDTLLEQGARGTLPLEFAPLERVVDETEIIFLAIQTPHDERFGGTLPLRDPPEDFDYTWLVRAVQDVVAERRATDPVPLAVISTVLPGTMEREVKPLLKNGLKLVYNPAFIAMGTVLQDFLHPEFVLLGVDDEEAAAKVQRFYETLIPQASVQRMSVASAELTKVAYNCAISTKIALANTLMEICDVTPGANVDEVTGALKLANKRIASSAYMDAGLGDGGGCHPRDNIAMSWLARRLGLSHDPFGEAMIAREAQSTWLCNQILSYIAPYRKWVIIAGYAFKPGTNITAGSPALLLFHQLETELAAMPNAPHPILWDPHVDPMDRPFPLRTDEAAVVVIGCRHPEFVGWSGEGLAEGSVIIDPHRITGDSVPGVGIVKLGTGRHA